MELFVLAWVTSAAVPVPELMAFAVCVVMLKDVYAWVVLPYVGPFQEASG